MRWQLSTRVEAPGGVAALVKTVAAPGGVAAPHDRGSFLRGWSFQKGGSSKRVAALGTVVAPGGVAALGTAVAQSAVAALGTVVTPGGQAALGTVVAPGGVAALGKAVDQGRVAALGTVVVSVRVAALDRAVAPGRMEALGSWQVSKEGSSPKVEINKTQEKDLANKVSLEITKDLQWVVQYTSGLSTIEEERMSSQPWLG